MNIPKLTRNALDRLIASEGGPHLSLFLPPPIVGHDTLEEERTRFSNLTRSAAELLTKYWMPKSEAKSFLDPLHPLLSDLLQQNPRRHSVAAFVCSQSHDVFCLDQELIEYMTIARAFHVRPLLPWLDEPDPYAVVTLSQQRVAFFARTQLGLERVTEVMPESFETTEADLMGEAQVRVAAVGGRGGQGVVFHGQRDARDVEKVDFENYLKHVDNSICSYLQQHPGTRLILAGVDSVIAMYRTNSHCENIVNQTLSGNVDHLSTKELQSRVEATVGDELHARRKQTGVRVREHDVPTATDPEQVLVAACAGRIDALFIDKHAQLNGSFAADQGILKEVQGELTGDPGDQNQDLIELAAVKTLQTGGMVYAVAAGEMPVATRMAAALRF